MRLTINRKERDIVPGPDESLLATLRDRLFLTGAKQGCDRGECGACTVLLNGEPVYACLTLTIACEGDEVTTVEGLAAGDALHPLQEAFVAHDAVQCGFCTPGLIIAAHDLLDRTPEPTEMQIREELSGNVCRCTGYGRIIEAVQQVAVARRTADAGAAS